MATPPVISKILVVDDEAPIRTLSIEADSGQMGLIGLPVLIVSAKSEAESQRLALEIGVPLSSGNCSWKPKRPRVRRE